MNLFISFRQVFPKEIFLNLPEKPSIVRRELVGGVSVTRSHLIILMYSWIRLLIEDVGLLH